jgi:hypothetical protein
MTIIRDILERAFDAHAHACLDDEVDRARLIDAIECELQSHPAALFVREALGADPIARVVRVAGANGRLQARLHDASYALAGGEETMTTPKKKPSKFRLVDEYRKRSITLPMTPEARKHRETFIARGGYSDKELKTRDTYKEELKNGRYVASWRCEIYADDKEGEMVWLAMDGTELHRRRMTAEERTIPLPF